MKKTANLISFSFVFSLAILALVPSAYAAPTSVSVSSLASFVGNSTTNTPGTDPGELAAGDFNCDGQDDIIIGAGGYSTGKGRIYVQFGGSAFSGATTLASTSMDVTITGATSEGIGGNIVVTDVDADGCQDIISLSGSGRFHTFLGATTWSGAYTNSSSVYTNMIARSVATGEYYQMHLLGRLEGDLDGDGDFDSADGFLAICSGAEMQCYLMPVAEVLDTSGSYIETLSLYWVQGEMISEAITSGYINEDDYADLIVGDPNDSESVSIWFGPLSSSSSDYYDSSDTPTNHFTAGDVGGEDILFLDTNTTQGYGATVFAEDIYAEDGYDDLIFGSVGETIGSAASAGRMHLISGESISDFRDTHTSTNGYVIWYTNSTTYDCSTSSNCDYDDVSQFYYNTGEANVEFGDGYQSSAFNGDLNGDGVKDFLMGASQYDGSAYKGRMYVVYGGAEDVNADTSADVNLNTDDSAIYYMDGANSGDGLSHSMVTADVTGDGLDDMLITADGYDSDEGILYVYPGAATDIDGDGFNSAEDDDGNGIYETYDCNDRDSSLYPTTWYLDSDGDGDGSASSPQEACGQPVGYVSNASDCNDSDSGIYSSATETCDGLDNNCDGTTDEGVTTSNFTDADGDGYGLAGTQTEECGVLPGHSNDNTDCNDSVASSYPGATETCDSIDNDCDGTADDGLATSTYYLDSDGDGYGSVSSPETACSIPSGYVANDSDCNDSSATSSPTGTETCGDSIDQNCDGSDLSCSSVDADGDGLSTDDGDCDDTNATVYPSATETCGDSIDQDCDGSDSTCPAADVDSDGYNTDTDCNDGDSSIYPGAAEVEDDGIDQDCDGSDAVSTSSTTDADGDGYASDVDCDDTNVTVYPGATELGDGIDNDCDDRFDEGLLNAIITSVPTSVNPGDSFDVTYDITNGTGVEDFDVEILINNSPIVAKSSSSWPPSIFSTFCNPSRCTTMDDSPVTVPIGTTTTTTTTVIMPATVTSGAAYTIRIRVTDSATGQFLKRDTDRVGIN